MADTLTEQPVGTAGARRSRQPVYDGLRGIAIVLVVLQHMWIVLVIQRPSIAVYNLLRMGDQAVSLFFVIGSFLAVRQMMAAVDQTGTVRFGVVALRRWVRLSAHVYPLVLAVLALTAIDRGMQTYSLSNTRESAWRIVTYSWNSYVLGHIDQARPDLGHLWYVCTDLQVIIVLAVVVYLLRRSRVALFAVLLVAALLIAVYHHHLVLTENPTVALLRSASRADALLWGAMAAVALPWLERWPREVRTAGLVALASLPVLFVWSVPVVNYFSVPGLLLDIALAVVAASAWVVPAPTWERRSIGSPPLQFLGRNSLGIYLWHFPIFFYISRNYLQWGQGHKLVVGLLATAAIATFMTYAVERPLQRWLRTPPWRSMQSDGIPETLMGLGRARLARLRAGGDGDDRSSSVPH